MGKMLNMEYVRSLNCNYGRVMLDRIPGEKTYQYCILERCRVKGLLSCSLRYINGTAYLYYDISSRQNISLLYSSRCITREWMRDFVWSMKQIRQELGRFLLDTANILWYPEYIFQELENPLFSFLYMPYYEGESGFMRLMEFWVEHLDYGDEKLVECVYHMYEKLERGGDVYLQSQFFADAECLEEAKRPELVCTVVEEKVEEPGKEKEDPAPLALTDTGAEKSLSLPEKPKRAGKRGILGILEGKRQHNREIRENYRESMQQAMAGYAVAETAHYEEKQYGRTIYIEDRAEIGERSHRLLTPEGKLLAVLDRAVLTIGKKESEVDLVLRDDTVSRIHARITKEDGGVYLEDLNSTNGTCRNGQRMQPYEKKRLDEGDEIKCGKIFFIFR